MRLLFICSISHNLLLWPIIKNQSKLIVAIDKTVQFYCQSYPKPGITMKFSFPYSVAALLPLMHVAAADKTFLYQNDFEKPKGTVKGGFPGCDQTPINDYFGGQGGTPLAQDALQALFSEQVKTSHGTGTFGQKETVELLQMNGAIPFTTGSPGGMNPYQAGDNIYAIGFICPVHSGDADDRLWLDFTAPKDQEYFTIEMDVANVLNSRACGAFNSVGPPIFNMILHDMDAGIVIQEHSVTGVRDLAEHQLDWAHSSTSFHKGTATNLRIEWDCTSNGYGALDNVVIYTDDTSPVGAVVVQPSDEYVQEVVLPKSSPSLPAEASDAGAIATGLKASSSGGKCTALDKLALLIEPIPFGANSCLPLVDPHFNTWSGIKFDFQ